jgi:shikimate dehydrogenase
MKLLGLIGYPLSHSFSKRYFTEKMERENITGCRFENFELPNIDAFKQQVLEPNPGLIGFAITIPYKKEIIRFLDDASHLPLPACNCVKISEGKLIGYNTDVLGLEQSLLAYLQPNHTPALVLGTGGAAEAAWYVLKKLNIPYLKVSRGGHNEAITYEEATKSVVAQHKLIINCTPLGTSPNIGEKPPIGYEGISSGHYLFDLVYNPFETAFLKEGKSRKATIKNGQDMLIIQAEENWKIWNF